MKDKIKNEQVKWAAAMRAGDVAEMVRCHERIERLTRMQNTLARINAKVAIVLGGA